jgi:beta-glucuronidase
MIDTYPLYPSRDAQLLDGIWDFRWIGSDVRADEVNIEGLTFPEVQAVPGVFDTELARRNARGVGVYRRRLTTRGGPVRLTLGGLGLHGRVFWDESLVGECSIPYAEMDFDFETEPGPHELRILIDNRFRPREPELFHADADFYGFGGIYRSVKLQRLPVVRLERVAVRTLDLARGRVRLDITTGGVADGTAVL